MSGRGRGRGRGGGAAQPNHLNLDNDNPTNSCGTCDNTTNDTAIGCDRCASWFCPTPMCLGLPQNIVDAIKSHNGNGIAFICTACRARGTGNNPVANVSSDAFIQLHEAVKALCKTVGSLAAEIKNVVPQGSGGGDQQGGGDRSVGAGHVAGFNTECPNFRQAVREETREMEERRIRKTSVILKGTAATSSQEVVTAFVAITNVLFGRGDIVLHDIVCVNERDRVYRAKIDNEPFRQDLLGKAKELKDIPEFSNVYVNRDLTYKQRAILKEKRRIRREAIREPTQDDGGQTGNVEVGKQAMIRDKLDRDPLF